MDPLDKDDLIWNPWGKFMNIFKTTQLSHEEKPSYLPLYWLVNRDPYHDLIITPYITAVFFVIPYIP